MQFQQPCKFDDSFFSEQFRSQMIAETDFYWLLTQLSARLRHFFGIVVRHG